MHGYTQYCRVGGHCQSKSSLLCLPNQVLASIFHELSDPVVFGGREAANIFLPLASSCRRLNSIYRSEVTELRMTSLLVSGEDSSRVRRRFPGVLYISVLAPDSKSQLSVTQKPPWNIRDRRPHALLPFEFFMGFMHNKVRDICLSGIELQLSTVHKLLDSSHGYLEKFILEGCTLAKEPFFDRTQFLVLWHESQKSSLENLFLIAPTEMPRDQRHFHDGDAPLFDERFFSVTNLPMLKTLFISGYTFPNRRIFGTSRRDLEVFKSLTGLITLIIHGSTFHDNLGKWLLPRLTQLRDLDVSGSRSITNYIARWIPQSLEFLDVSTTRALEHRVDDPLFTRPDRENHSLKVFYANSLNCENFQNFLPLAPGLKEVSLTQVIFISCRALPQFLRLAQGLTSIDLSGSKGICQDAYIFMSSLSHLETLSLTDTSTNDGDLLCLSRGSCRHSLKRLKLDSHSDELISKFHQFSSLRYVDACRELVSETFESCQVDWPLPKYIKSDLHFY